MKTYSTELICETKKTFEPEYGRTLSDEEAEEIIENMTRFAELLIDAYQEGKKNKKHN